MAVSELTRPRWLIAPIPRAVAIANTKAPRYMLAPSTNARATPPKLAWARASPMNASPFNTTKLPRSPQMAATSTEATSPRCIKPNSSGPRRQPARRHPHDPPEKPTEGRHQHRGNEPALHKAELQRSEQVVSHPAPDPPRQPCG